MASRIEGGSNSAEKSKVEKARGFMRGLGLMVFGVLTAVSVVTVNPALGYAATTGLLADFTVDGIIDGGVKTYKGARKKKQ